MRARAMRAARVQVEGLLRAHESKPGVLVGPAAQLDSVGASGSTVVTPRQSEQPGDMIDRYRLIRLLGEGGFGRSFCAADRAARPRRRVKSHPPGDGHRSHHQRLENERQALAMMDHPGIARVPTPAPPRPAGLIS